MYFIFFILLLILLIVIVSGSAEKKYTYKIFAKNSANFDYTQLAKTSLKAMKEYNKSTGKIDLLWFELEYYDNNKVGYESTKLTARICNLLKYGSWYYITNKKAVYGIIPNYMPKYYINEMPAPNIPVIIKRIGQAMCSGVGNTFTYDEKIIRKYINDEKYVVQEYLTNLATFKGLKFHSFFFKKKEIHLLIAPDLYSLYEDGRIFTAEKPYIKGDWTNIAIHDTHIRHTAQNYYLKRDCKLISDREDIYTNLYTQMDTICKIIWEKNKSIIEIHPSADYSFEIFGVDFLVDDTLKIWFLEANAMPSYKSCGKPKKDYIEYARGFYKWAYKTAILPKL